MCKENNIGKNDLLVKLLEDLAKRFSEYSSDVKRGRYKHLEEAIMKYHYLKQCLYLVHRDPYKHGHGVSSWMPRIVRKLYTMEGLQRRIRKVLTKYDYATAPYAASYTDGYKKILPKYIIDEYTTYNFEGHPVQGIKHYDPYLKCMYGDYMTVPPEEDRWQHNFHYLDLDHPYREYKENNKY